jgi:beta-lactam-binding protein with PASTA domain
MPDNKDFLDQFSDAGKPASFKEEERVPIKKEKKPLNTKALAITAGVLLVLAIASYFLFFAPKIEMPNFVGMTKNDVAAWVKQQGIDATGILFVEQYDFDTDDGTILTQSVNSGKKVRKDVKINFNLSKGADPDERINVPDLYAMEKEDIQAWISENKLQKTKISTSYNEDVPANGVIDYTFTGCEEDSFTRACSLKINVSKGSAPAGSVAVEDFEKKPYATVESWAKSKKININKVEQYSDKVDKDYVISQSVSAGRTMKEGETLTVVVSLGKAVNMPDIIGWKRAEVRQWCSKNGIPLDDSEEDYATSTGLCIKQSIPAGTLVKEGDYLTVIISKGNPKIPDFTGQSFDELREWVNQANIESANLTLNNPTYKISDTYESGEIIWHTSSVVVGGTIDVTISEGRNILLKNINIDGKEISWDKLSISGEYTEDEARKLCLENSLTCNVTYVAAEGMANGRVKSAERSDGLQLKTSTYCPQSTIINIIVVDNPAPPEEG